jgi:hypothetical protein
MVLEVIAGDGENFPLFLFRTTNGSPPSPTWCCFVSICYLGSSLLCTLMVIMLRTAGPHTAISMPCLEFNMSLSAHWSKAVLSGGPEPSGRIKSRATCRPRPPPQLTQIRRLPKAKPFSRNGGPLAKRWTCCAFRLCLEKVVALDGGYIYEIFRNYPYASFQITFMLRIRRTKIEQICSNLILLLKSYCTLCIGPKGSGLIRCAALGGVDWALGLRVFSGKGFLE